MAWILGLGGYDLGSGLLRVIGLRALGLEFRSSSSLPGPVPGWLLRALNLEP